MGVGTDRELAVLGYLGDILGAILDQKHRSSVYTKEALAGSSVAERMTVLLIVRRPVSDRHDGLDIAHLGSFLRV
jgi:hypothetical protein